MPLLFSLYAGLDPGHVFVVNEAGVLACSAGASALAATRPGFRRRIAALLAFAGLGFFLALGIELGARRPAIVLGLPPERVTILEGTVASDPRELRGGRSLFVLRLQSAAQRDGASASSSGRIMVETERAAPRMGGRVSVAGRLAPPRAGGPGSSASPRGGPLFTASAVRPLVPEWSSPLLELRNLLLQSIEAKIDRLGGACAGFFKALFLGVSDDLEEAERYYFMHAGAVHILALSGMHLTILAGFITTLAVPLLGRRLSVALTSVAAVSYLFLTGFPISLVRAVVMYLLFGASVALERRAPPLQLLAGSFVVVVVVDPVSSYSLSFMLSYSALAGIVCLGARARSLFVPYLPRGVGSSLGASIGATIATTPIVVASFGIFYPIGLLSGLLLSPIVTAFLWGGLVYLLLPGCFVSSWLGDGLRLTNSLISAVAEMCARAPAVRMTSGCTAAFAAAIMLYLPLLVRKRWFELRFAPGHRRATRARRACPQETLRPELPRFAKRP